MALQFPLPLAFSAAEQSSEAIIGMSHGRLMLLLGPRRLRWRLLLLLLLTFVIGHGQEMFRRKMRRLDVVLTVYTAGCMGPGWRRRFHPMFRTGRLSLWLL